MKLEEGAMKNEAFIRGVNVKWNTISATGSGSVISEKPYMSGGKLVVEVQADSDNTVEIPIRDLELMQ